MKAQHRSARGCLGGSNLTPQLSKFDYSILVHASGRETHVRTDRALQMQRSGSVCFAGRREGKPVYMESKEVYFWNGSGPPSHMHRPGEVVS